MAGKSKKTEVEKIVLQYAKNIKAREIPSCIWVQKAVARFMSDIKNVKSSDFDFMMDWESVQDFFDFTKELKLPDQKENLKLLPWQLFILANLLGWKYKTNLEKRRFRSGAVYVPRKNGKTSGLLFPLSIWDFLTTDAAESYFFAKDENQSTKSYRELIGIMKALPDLAESCTMTTSAITMKNSRISFFSSESVGIDGYRPSLAIIDEFWCFDNERCVTAMRYGGRARLNNLTLVITTAGLDISLPAYAEQQKVQKILSGLVTDESYFGIIYGVDDGDDWKLPSSYVKANPSIDTIIDRAILEQDLQDALTTPSHQPDYISKTLNRWTTGTSSWIPLQAWEKNRRIKVDLSTLKGLPCFGALDLSAVNDYTAYTLYFRKEGRYFAKHRFYIPADTVEERARKENIGIREWIQKGYVTATPGSAIDYDFIIRDILEDAKLYDIREIAYDRNLSGYIVGRLNDELPAVDFVDFNQSMVKMSPATKQFEKEVRDGRIVDLNPVMQWMIGNVEVYVDHNGNYKVNKKGGKSSTNRIDGVVTSIMALDRLFAAGPVSTRIYTTEEMLAYI